MLPLLRARKLAAALDLDVDTLPICHLCLFDVAMAVDHDSEPQIRGALVRITPDLWAEGLEAPAREALVDAQRRGVADAGRALAELDAAGPRTTIARAIVRRLAEDMNVRARAAYAALTN
ncbi:MAG: hypothetical protein ACYDA3_10485 [Gaiellaceae bacterium]